MVVLSLVAVAFARRRKPKLKRRIVEMRFTVQGQIMWFITEATRSLGVYLDMRLWLRTQKDLTFEKATRVEESVRRLAATRGPKMGLL